MKTSSCKAKGTKLEKQTAQIINKHLSTFGIEVKRVPASGANLNCPGDVWTSIGQNFFPFLIECKKHEGWSLRSVFNTFEKTVFYRWWEEAVRQTTIDRTSIPLVVFSKNFDKTYVLSLYDETFVHSKIIINGQFQIALLDNWLAEYVKQLSNILGSTNTVSLKKTLTLTNTKPLKYMLRLTRTLDVIAVHERLSKLGIKYRTVYRYHKDCAKVICIFEIMSISINSFKNAMEED